MKKDKWYGKISVHEFDGKYYITLDMPRDPDEAQMFFIIEWLLKPWVGKKVKIDISEVDELPPREKKPPIKEELLVQETWAKKFREMGVV